jgi:DNA polymerase-3 subunit beta
VAGLDPEQFPVAPDQTAPLVDLMLNAALLAQLVGSVGHAIAPADNRPTLAGILVQVRDTMLTLASADGFRMAVRSVPIEAADLGIIVSGKPLIKAAGAIKAAESVRLQVDQHASALLLDTEVGSWSLRLIEGQYPDFQRIIPTDPPVRVTCLRDDILRALRLVNRIEQTATGYRVHLRIERNAIGLRAGTDTTDQEAGAEIDAELEAGEPFSVAYNTAYLSDAVSAIEGERVALDIGGALKPCIIRAAGEPDGHLQIIMPMATPRAGAERAD